MVALRRSIEVLAGDASGVNSVSPGGSGLGCLGRGRRCGPAWPPAWRARFVLKRAVLPVAPWPAGCGPRGNAVADYQVTDHDSGTTGYLDHR
jgi:hypothetical protein